MTPNEFLAALNKFIEYCEESYFTGAFSESVIKDDLQSRKASDTYSTLGSNPRQTNQLAEKKQFYINDFNSVEDELDTWIRKIREVNPDHPWIARCEKCKNQIVKLRKIVRNFY